MPPADCITRTSHPTGVRLIATAVVASLAVALAGCATPRLQSTVDVPSQFTAASETVTEPEVAWWESYGDPVLTSLVARAARENRDIRIAVARVRAARAGETITRSALLPNIGAAANASNAHNGYSDSARQAAPETQSASAGRSVSWEIDLTGRLRAGAAAAAAEAQASEDQARGMRLLVLSDVASNYFTLVGAKRQLPPPSHETREALQGGRDARSPLRSDRTDQRPAWNTSATMRRSQPPGRIRCA